MSEHDKAFDGSIPKLYDTYLVPLIFEPYAIDLAERAVGFEPANASLCRALLRYSAVSSPPSGIISFCMN